VIDIGREIDDPFLLGGCLNNMAVVLSEGDQDHTGALAIQEEALAIARRSNSRQATTVALDELGQIRRQLGDLSGATSAFQESLAIQTESAEVFAYMGEAEQGLAAVALDEENTTRARNHLRSHTERIRPISRRDGYSDIDPWFPLVEWARVAILADRGDIALTLLSADQAYYDLANRVRLPSQQADFEAALHRAQDILSTRERERAAATGESLSRGAALDYAVDALG